MLEQLKKEVYEANMDLVAKGMVIYTWGNVSGIDREKGLVVIKPSGVDYATMTWEDMVVVDMEGNVVEGKYKPSQQPYRERLHCTQHLPVCVPMQTGHGSLQQHPVQPSDPFLQRSQR